LYSEETTVKYKIRAELPGTYKVLPARAELMYAPEIYGFSNATNLIVSEEKEFKLPKIEILPYKILVTAYPTDEQAAISLKLVDLQGKTIATASGSGNTISIPLTEKLSEGKYNLNYSVSSANANFSGSKAIQQGRIEVQSLKFEQINFENELIERNPEKNNSGLPLFSETTSTSKEFQENFLIIIAAVLAIVIVIFSVWYWLKKS